ncbi:MAG: hypothetical protein ABGX07_03840, partial [Pirellulaceae bacterium]
MSIAYLLIFATTSLMNAEQALKAATSAAEPVIAVISEPESTSPPESASSVSPVGNAADSEVNVTAAIDNPETNDVAGDAADANAAEITPATEVVVTEFVEAEVVEAEVVEAEVVEAEVVEAEVVEAEVVEAEVVEAEVVEAEVV